MPYLESSGEGAQGGDLGHTCPSLPPTPFPIFGFTAVVKAWDLVIFSPLPGILFYSCFSFPSYGGWMGRVPITPWLHEVPPPVSGPIPAPCFLLYSLPHAPHTGVGERSQVAELDGEEAG